MAKSTKPKVGDIIVITLTSGAKRPAVITSINDDGTPNARAITEPGDNPRNDGNFQTFFPNIGSSGPEVESPRPLGGEGQGEGETPTAPDPQ